MTLSSAVSNIAMVVVGIGLVVLARWAARRTGTRWESLVALRTGDVLFTEVVGAFLVGYAAGAIVAPPGDRSGPPLPPGGGRFVRPGLGFGSGQLPFTLGLIAAVLAVLQRIDLRDLLLRGRGERYRRGHRGGHRWNAGPRPRRRAALVHAVLTGGLTIRAACRAQKTTSGRGA